MLGYTFQEKCGGDSSGLVTLNFFWLRKTAIEFLFQMVRVISISGLIIYQDRSEDTEHLL